MKTKFERRTIIYCATALILFGCLFLLTFRDGRPEERQAPQIVVFGDSVPGMVRDHSGIAAQVGSLLDKTVYNAALGGTCISRLDRENRLDYGKDSLSLSALAKAVYMEDFGVQQTVRLREPMTEYFADTIDELERIDFSAVETVLIEHGLNDFYAGVPLDNEANDMDEYTFAGALRSALTSLRKANPHMRILLVTPTYTWLTAEGVTCQEFDAGYGNVDAYVQKEMEVAEEYGVEIIDLYHDFFPHEQWEDWKLYTEDGMHPNEAGRTLITEKIVEYLNGRKE